MKPCLFYFKGISLLHAVRFLHTYGSGRRGSKVVRVHIGPHWAEGVGQAPPEGCGSGFSLAPGYTTLLGRVRANFSSVPLK